MLRFVAVQVATDNNSNCWSRHAPFECSGNDDNLSRVVAQETFVVVRADVSSLLSPFCFRLRQYPRCRSNAPTSQVKLVATFVSRTVINSPRRSCRSIDGSIDRSIATTPFFFQNRRDAPFHQGRARRPLPTHEPTHTFGAKRKFTFGLPPDEGLSNFWLTHAQNRLQRNVPDGRACKIVERGTFSAPVDIPTVKPWGLTISRSFGRRRETSSNNTH